MKQILCVSFLIMLSVNGQVCLAQNHSIPKNSVGAFAGIEWNTLSALTGVNYERSVLKRERLTLGIKAVYVFTYENGTVGLFTSFDGFTSLTAIMPTLHFFPSRNSDDNEGFFLMIGTGAVSRKHEDRPNRYTKTVQCGEVGIGWQFYMGNKTTLALHTSLMFAGKGGITLMRLSLGF